MPTDSVDLIGMYVIDEYTEVLVFKYKAYIMQIIVITDIELLPTIISFEYSIQCIVIVYNQLSMVCN